MSLSTSLGRDPQKDNRLNWLIGCLACLLLGALYFYTATGVHTFDALSYTWNVEAKPMRDLFHPHHLLYGPAGKLAYQSAVALGYDGRADKPIQALNALAGAVGVFFLWRFGVCWTGRRWATLGSALVVGLSYAYWVYSAEVEVYTFAAAFLSLSLWLLARFDRAPTAANAIALGFAHCPAGVELRNADAAIVFRVATGAAQPTTKKRRQPLA